MTISVVVWVEADSEEEARAKAEEADVKSLCYGCSSWHAKDNGEEEWSADELDGTPRIVEVSECD